MGLIDVLQPPLCFRFFIEDFHDTGPIGCYRLKKMPFRYGLPEDRQFHAGKRSAGNLFRRIEDYDVIGRDPQLALVAENAIQFVLSADGEDFLQGFIDIDLRQRTMKLYADVFASVIDTQAIRHLLLLERGARMNLQQYQ